MKNLLLLTRSPIKETNGVGNTYSNFFSGFNKKNIFNLYCRSEFPENKICDSYFQITEKSIIQNCLTPSNIGKSFYYDEISLIKDSKKIENEINNENKILDYFRNNRSTLSLFARDLLWKFGSWKNNKLKSYLISNKIDVIFAIAPDCLYLYYLLDYCKRITNAKVVLFFADDVYSYLSHAPHNFLYKKLVRSKIKRVISQTSLIYGASIQLCNEYAKIFNRSITPLYKGCNFEGNIEKTKVNNPIVIAYAGNMLYGRDKVLAILSEEIQKINSSIPKMILCIYTQATLTEELDRLLNVEGASYLMGGLAYNEVKKVLRDADIVLHVESNNKKQKKLTRLSFSTKIVDCMQSSSCMLAIGPNDVASMQYIINADIAFVASNRDELHAKLQSIIDNPNSLLEKARKMRDYAKLNHDLVELQTKIEKDINNI